MEEASASGSVKAHPSNSAIKSRKLRCMEAAKGEGRDTSDFSWARSVDKGEAGGVAAAAAVVGTPDCKEGSCSKQRSMRNVGDGGRSDSGWRKILPRRRNSSLRSVVVVVFMETDSVCVTS